MRAIYSYGIAGVIILLLAAWLATGTFVAGGHGPGEGERPLIALFEEEGGPISNAIEDSGLAAHHEEGGEHIDPHLTIAERVAQNGGSETVARSVRTETFTVQPFAIEAPLRGRTKAKASVSVMPETAGVVETVHVTKGQSVAAGDLICTLEAGPREAALTQAESALDQAQLDFDTNAELRSEGLAPANSVRGVELALRTAQAQLDNARTELERTKVRTQVAGVIQDPLATPGSLLGPQAPCATVVELNPMLFVGAVPEARIGLAKIGLPAKVTTVAGQTVEGKVSYIASTADPATRSFPVEIEIPNADFSLRDGLTATAVVNLGTAPAHLLPQSVLTLDDDGVLGIRSVSDNVVEFHAVTIVSDTREGVWVTGLPPKVDVITVGQEYVQPGQTVNATNVAASPSDEAPAESVQS
jgi:multidrug efflux system membrane fusion protein